MDCPRCRAPLVPMPIGDLSTHQCPGCGGTVVALRDLERTLAAVASPRAEPPQKGAADPTPALPCPRCQRAMSRGSYLEQGLVNIDRCTSCMLLFADAGELETMAAQRQRSNEQREASEATREATRRQVDWSPVLNDGG